MGASTSFAELFVAESEEISAARGRSAELGCTPVSSGVAATLTMLASALGARAVVEIGTGAGVSGLALLSGMTADGVLTSIDVEAEHQRAAKQGFSAAGFGSGRARLINGRALDVLPRLTDGAYDLVLIDADRSEYPAYVPQAIRLLRPGGALVLAGALHGDRVADPTNRDAHTVAVREAGRLVRDDELLVPALLPVGDGLLVAVRRA